MWNYIYEVCFGFLINIKVYFSAVKYNALKIENLKNLSFKQFLFLNIVILK